MQSPDTQPFVGFLLYSVDFDFSSATPLQSFKIFSHWPDESAAAKLLHLRESASSNTQYKLTQASTFPGPRFSTSGHRSKGSPPLHSAQALPPCTRPMGVAP